MNIFHEKFLRVRKRIFSTALTVLTNYCKVLFSFNTKPKMIKPVFPQVVLAIVLLSLQIGYAEAPSLQWQKTFGGSGNDSGCSVQQTSDGGYIIAGSTASYGAGSNDIYLIKTNSSGNKQWEKTFGGSGDDSGHSVQQTSDGGYIIVGNRNDYGFPYFYGYCLIKTNSSGVKQWEKTFGMIRIEEYGRSVQQTSDGGYIIVGNVYTRLEEIHLIKTNSSGVQQWENTFYDPGGDFYSYNYGFSVQQTSDSGYIIAGCTSPVYGGSVDVYLIKTNSSGVKQWGKTFGGSGYDSGSSVQQTSDGGYIIAGSTNSYGAGSSDIYLIKTNSSGVKQWGKTFGGSGNDSGCSVRQTSDGGYIIAGSTTSYGAGSSDIYLIKTNSSGSKLWEKTLGGSGYDSGSSVQQTSDGGYIIAGSTTSYGAGSSDVYLVKLETNAVNLTATNNWDGKTISLSWSSDAGSVKIYRKKESGSFEYITTVSSSSYTNTVPEPGKNYTYVLKNTSGSQISNEATVKAEVVIVLVRGYSLTGDGNDPDSWKSNQDEQSKGLVPDVKQWFENRGLICWDASAVSIK
jgi:hypothetical protein